MRAVDPLPDTYYAKTPDGAYIAYQVIGDGPIDVVSQSDWPGNIDVEQEDPLAKVWFRELASFSRLILHDRRASVYPAGTLRFPTSRHGSRTSWSSWRR